jgi:TP901 family phage tail tape measure protein
MSRFAVEANKAARALSTTTNEYAKASLIYYQQGLSAEAVKERSDVTVKLANVTGETAEEVSNYMTAVWNNFDNGSKSLEYYADVMTKLGAATASSTDEIAAGLEKFSAIAETVGLSYEYATAALATVTSETRQSADVVGTAFKTLFGRLQGLKLGETLEDGTSLNKYSEALAAVGVNIKAQNGELKDMDVILNELGAKWKTIGKDAQVALAQTVGGARQYNQLISLMDNWDKF